MGFTQPLTITTPVNGEVYRAALGEKLSIWCEGHGDGDNRNLLYWREGQSVVEQFAGHCYDLDIKNRSCISPMYDKYRALRLKSYRIRVKSCISFSFQRSLLDISIANWTDNVRYTCVTSKQPSTVERNVSVTVVVG